MWHPHGTTQLDYNVIDVTKINHLHMNDYDNDVIFSWCANIKTNLKILFYLIC